MKYEFLIKEFPESKGWFNKRSTKEINIIAYTEGTLKILIDEEEFLYETGILLVEFAIFLSEWLLLLDKGEVNELYYASMDFEEEPIVHLSYDENKQCFYFSSVWQKRSCSEGISINDAERAAKDYLGNLKHTIFSEYLVDIQPILDNAIASP